ncbi:MAG: hypothetical protein ACFFFC_16125 [Candidatus Thorarchaeota archaeon]
MEWSSKWKLNPYYAAYISLPLFLGVLTILFTPFPLGISIGFILVAAAPSLWALELLIYGGYKMMKKRSGEDGIIPEKIKRSAYCVSTG